MVTDAVGSSDRSQHPHSNKGVWGGFEKAHPLDELSDVGTCVDDSNTGTVA